MLYESHCHTPLCGHATGEPEEYAAMAELRGLKGIIFTCHAPLPGGFSARQHCATHRRTSLAYSIVTWPSPSPVQ